MNLENDLRRACDAVADAPNAVAPPVGAIRRRGERQRAGRAAALVVVLLVAVGGLAAGMRSGGGESSIDYATHGPEPTVSGPAPSTVAAPMSSVAGETPTTESPGAPSDSGEPAESVPETTTTAATEAASPTSTTTTQATSSKTTQTVPSVVTQPVPTTAPRNPPTPAPVPTTTSPSNNSNCPRPPSGHWGGTWTSTALPGYGGELSADLVLQGSSVTGTLYLTGSPLFTSVPVVGTINCQLVDLGGGFVGALNASATSALGQYSILGVDNGTWAISFQR